MTASHGGLSPVCTEMHSQESIPVHFTEKKIQQLIFQHSLTLWTTSPISPFAKHSTVACPLTPPQFWAAVKVCWF
uniref:Uncharacterized protein n=1 Tax=Anguilla anguilla TaxID=7936 RepID=A0A0E9RB41_ANGAN